MVLIVGGAVGIMLYILLFRAVDDQMNGAFVDWFFSSFVSDWEVDPATGITYNLVFDPIGAKEFFLRLGLVFVVVLVASSAIASRTYARCRVRETSERAAELLAFYMRHDAEASEVFPEGLGALEPVEAAGMAEQKDAPDEEAVSLRRGGEERHGTAAARGAGSPAAPAAHAPLGAGPARYYRFPDAQGTVGFISAMSNHFCSSCNRLRLTADGAIRPCLFSDDEYPVRDALRRGADDEVLATYRAALAHKPKEHELIEGTERFMSQIGG